MSVQSEGNPLEKLPRVLVVDDEKNIRRAMLLMLKNDFEVTALESGTRAVEEIRRGAEFDVVSLDNHMPGLTGIETLKVIKEYAPKTEVLIVTAHSDLESAKEALRLGAYEYIDKPFEKAAFREAVRKGIERRSRSATLEKAHEELRFVRAQLIQSEKFASIGQLLAGVVHEINNPLMGAMGFTEILMMGKCSPEQTKHYLENIKRSIEICQSVAEKLLSFSRKQEPHREYLQVNHVIHGTLELKEHDFKIGGVQVTESLCGGMPGTVADFHQLQQVLLNLINNAQQAMTAQEGPRAITVTSEFDEEWIRIAVHDTGPGIPEENFQKIFEPLFTTKEKGKGTGLGLSVCYQIIEEHQGRIYVASKPGKGACFIVELPVIAHKTMPAGPLAEERRRRPQGFTA